MAGIGPFGRGRIESNLEQAKAAAQVSSPTSRSRNTGQIRTAAAYESTRTDFGPWVETPNSSRVSMYRYDYLNDSMQVMWKNNIRAKSGPSSPTAVPGTVYGEVANGTPITYEMFRQYARAVSKGKAVNSMLNGWGYRGMSTDERDANSNGRYRAPSRARD